MYNYKMSPPQQNNANANADKIVADLKEFDRLCEIYEKHLAEVERDEPYNEELDDDDIYDDDGMGEEEELIIQIWEVAHSVMENGSGFQKDKLKGYAVDYNNYWDGEREWENLHPDVECNGTCIINL